MNIAELRDQYIEALLATGFRKRGHDFRLPLATGYFIVVAPVTDKEFIDPRETFFALVYILAAQVRRDWENKKRLDKRLDYVIEISQREAISKGVSGLIILANDWEIEHDY